MADPLEPQALGRRGGVCVTRVVRALACLAALTAFGLAAAQQGWAVQVVALRDYQEAQAATAQLTGLGFPAYTEYAMDDGRQFVRVRVGCYGTREAADAMAQAMRGRVTADAQAVELTPGALAPGCVQEVIGFLNGYDWRLTDDDGPVTFEVTVAGVPATVAHDGERWRMIQDGADVPLAGPATVAGEYASTSVGGATFAVRGGAGTSYVVCPGRLLAQVGEVAIVERGDALVACRWTSGGLP